MSIHREDEAGEGAESPEHAQPHRYTSAGEVRTAIDEIQIPRGQPSPEELEQSPASDLPSDVRPLIARYGATCQPGTLVNWLNAQIRSCQIRNWDDSDDCRPTGNEWRMCAPLFDHGYITDQAPTLHERCRNARDGDGYLVETCSYTWTQAGAPAPAETSSTRGSPWPLNRAPSVDLAD